MKLGIPELCLVVMVGSSGSGKSTFARRHFKPTEVISSDFCRGLVSDDENNQAATGDAFDVLHYVVSKRLKRGLLTVIDATNVQPESRKPLVALARDHDVLPVAMVLKIPEQICHDRNRSRADRQFGPHVIRNQSIQLRRSLRDLQYEGFRYVHVLNSPEEVESAEVERQPLWNNRKWDKGPFDFIGDVHGCCDELIELLQKLGYETSDRDKIIPPQGRKAVFVGDLVDRGPDVVGVLKIVMGMAARGAAVCVPGNHDDKLLRKLQGRNVKIAHGLEKTLEQLESTAPDFQKQVETFLDGLVGHYVLDNGRIVVAHAGLKECYIGRASRRVREFALYGDTTGEVDDLGLPVRQNWAAEYRGESHIVYGHTPVQFAEWLNGTINIDTGCVFGGKLTALRWPERELVSVQAKQTYAEPGRPFITVPAEPGLSAQQVHDDVLDIQDVTGKRLIDTRLHRSVTIRAENSAAALEVMSRFAANPRWLIYLPPTMSPSETTARPGLLEHPEEAFAYFRSQGVGRVICQEKHMGSRAVAIVCRDEEAARRRFGVSHDGIGIVYTRTGRRFFDDRAVEAQMLDILRSAIESAGLWKELATDWVCLDCELMPWSAKAQELLRTQYAAVGSAAQASASAGLGLLEQAIGTHTGDGTAQLTELAQQFRTRIDSASRYVAAYRHYCWAVTGVQDLKLAPFHLLASEGAVHVGKDHLWHMGMIGHMTGSGILMQTAHRLVDTTDATSLASGIEWWEGLTAHGGEGMVVKPIEFVTPGPRGGPVQPAVKCRGPEYLRIIYGPEYDAPRNLERLRRRALAGKRSLAIREFALGIEGLERFVRKEPLRRVHECVFGVLALESEPVDPRL